MWPPGNKLFHTLSAFAMYCNLNDRKGFKDSKGIVKGFLTQGLKYVVTLFSIQRADCAQRLRGTTGKAPPE